MSYCRCGEDSDIYMYGDGKGWSIHIANTKHTTYNMPDHIKYSGDPKLQLEWIRENSEPLDKPRAGEDIHLSTLQECLDALKQLREEEYLIPQHAIDRVIREMDDI